MVIRIPGGFVWVFALIMVGEMSAKTTCIISWLIHISCKQSYATRASEESGHGGQKAWGKYIAKWIAGAGI